MRSIFMRFFKNQNPNVLDIVFDENEKNTLVQTPDFTQMLKKENIALTNNEKISIPVTEQSNEIWTNFKHDSSTKYFATTFTHSSVEVKANRKGQSTFCQINKNNVEKQDPILAGAEIPIPAHRERRI